jgi:hypothetical protein
MKKIKILILSILSVTSLSVLSSDLNPVATFYRCYSQITGEYPSSTLATITEVKNGKDPITACLEIFDLAKFADKTSFLENVTNPSAQAVLRTMNNLHSSWFATNHFPEIREKYITNTANVFDPSSPAMYFTKALFDQQSQYKNIISNTTTYRPIRIINTPPVSPWNLIPKEDYIFTDVKFAGASVLLGMETMAVNDTMDFTFLKQQAPATPEFISGTLTYNTHFGGGVLGSQPYLLQTVQANNLNPKFDGGVLTARKWSRAVFNDLLCRSLPVVREADGAAYVDVSSSIAFRQSMSCVKCHTSMDRMAGVTRGVVYDQSAGKFFNLGHSAFISQRTVDKSAADIFPTDPDADFYRRPTQGQLFYREHDGKLVDLAINNVEELGEKLSQEDGIYNCLAKRYYQFFTGISVDIGDIADPQHGILSQEELALRAIVLQLGQQLKTHQNPRMTIESILRRSEYRKSNYNVGSF